jgi:hypothetical protein
VIAQRNKLVAALMSGFDERTKYISLKGVPTPSTRVEPSEVHADAHGI